MVGIEVTSGWTRVRRIKFKVLQRLRDERQKAFIISFIIWRSWTSRLDYGGVHVVVFRAAEELTAILTYRCAAPV